jgi:hypothetical protein
LALVQAEATVAREYRQQTQLFVEALPLPRWKVPLAKLVWGLATQSALAGTLWLLMALGSGDTAPRFLAITGVRTFGYVLVCWSVAFGLAMLGRLRWLAYATLAIAYYAAQQQHLELEHFGPFALLDPRSFPYERAVFPVRALLESAGVTACAVSLGLGLPSLHEGSMAEQLARRASTGEKAGFWAVLAAQLSLVFSMQRTEQREPFRFTGTGVLLSERQDVQIMYAADELEPSARRMLGHLERLVERLETDLQVAELPTVRVVHNPSLESVRSVVGAGVLLEGNIGAKNLEDSTMPFLAAHRMFVELSATRGEFEPNHWFLDGFARRWSLPSDQALNDACWLDALVARRRLPLDERQLQDWDRLSELIGDQVALSIGYTLVEVLEYRHGRERVLQLARALLARPTVRNGFDWLLGKRADLPELLEQTTGESWPSFVAGYQAHLDAATTRLTERLAAIPALSATVAVESTEVSNDVVYQLSGLAPARALDCQLHHVRLPPYDVAASGGKEERLIWPAGAPRVEVRLRGQYQSGERLLATIDCLLPGLLRRTRLEARRLEVP